MENKKKRLEKILARMPDYNSRVGQALTVLKEMKNLDKLDDRELRTLATRIDALSDENGGMEFIHPDNFQNGMHDPELLDFVIEKWANRIIDPDRINKRSATKYLNWIYKLAYESINEDYVKPIVIYTKSPFGVQIGCNVLDLINRLPDLKPDEEFDIEDLKEKWDENIDVDAVIEVIKDVLKKVPDPSKRTPGDFLYLLMNNQRKFFSFAFYGNIWDSPWIAYYDYLRTKGEMQTDELDKYLAFMKTNIFDMVQLKNYCIVSEMPVEIHIDDEDRAHNEEGAPSLLWADGFRRYDLDGVTVPRSLYEKIHNRTLTEKELFAIENKEVQMVAMKYAHPDLLLKSKFSTHIKTSDRNLGKGAFPNELYRIDDIFPKPTYFVRYGCPSTGRVYMEAIQPEVAEANLDPDECMASKGSMTLDEYINLHEGHT